MKDVKVEIKPLPSISDMVESFNNVPAIDQDIDRIIRESATTKMNSLWEEVFEQFCEKLPDYVTKEWMEERGYGMVMSEQGYKYFTKHGLRVSPKLKEEYNTTFEDGIAKMIMSIKQF